MLWSLGVKVLFFFFFKQKTAYEMRISDWSSDVCSSDLSLEDDGESPAAPYAHRLDSLAQVPLAQFVGECPSNASAGYPDRMTKRDSRPIDVEPPVPDIILTPSPRLDYCPNLRRQGCIEINQQIGRAS